MQIAIIGTSNSIMTAGWTRAARVAWACAGGTVTNLSLGGSSARHAAFVLHDDDTLWRSDRIVIESAINDQMFISARVAHADHAIASYAAILQRAWARGALDRLLILLFPMQQRGGRVANAGLIDRLVAMFTFYGVAHIDLRAPLLQWTGDDNVPIAQAHQDPRHIAPRYQDKIGDLVAQFPTTLAPLSPLQRAARAGLGQMTDIRLRRLTVLAEFAVPTESVGTRLQMQEVQCFAAGQRFRITGAAVLVGAMIWTHDRAGGLVFGHGRAARRLNLRRSYAGIFLFDSFFRAVSLAPSTVVEVANPRHVPLLRTLALVRPQLQIAQATVAFVALVGADVDPICLAAEVDHAMGKAVSPRLRRVRVAVTTSRLLQRMQGVLARLKKILKQVRSYRWPCDPPK
jgi:hypothetical protein